MAKVGDARTAEAGLPVLDIAAALTMLAVFSLTTGYSYPAISFNLEARGFSAGLIGAQGACAGLGILVGSLATPALAVRVGTWPLAAAGMYGAAVCIAAFGFSENVPLWFVLRFLLGACVSVLFIVSDTWVNELAPDAVRGRVISVYAAVNAGLFALGPLLIPVIGYEGPAAFGAMAAAVAVMGLSIFRLRRLGGPLEAASFGLTRGVIVAIPLLIAAVTAFGYLDGAALSLWVVYALSRGLDETGAAWTLTAMIVGNVALQFPIGWLADRMSRRRLLALLAAGGFLGAAAIPLIDFAAWWGIAWLVAWGAVAFGVYTLALTIVGQHLSGIRLVAAAAAFGVAWGLGALAGAWLTGGLMQALGPWALPASIAAVYALLTLACIVLPPIREGLARVPPR